MKLSDLDRIMAGTRAIRRVECPIVNVPGPLQADQPEMAQQRAANTAAAQPGQAPPVAPPTVEVGLRVLTGEETSFVYEKAWAEAQRKGCPKPDETDPVYALALSVWTLAVACVDPDSEPAKPELFFGSTPAEAAAAIYASPHLGRDGIAYLCEQHEVWQDLCHPQAKNAGFGQIWERVTEALTDDPRFFLQMRPALRWSFVRFMASLLATLLPDKSTPGSSSETPGKNAPKADP